MMLMRLLSQQFKTESLTEDDSLSATSYAPVLTLIGRTISSKLAPLLYFGSCRSPRRKPTESECLLHKRPLTNT